MSENNGKKKKRIIIRDLPPLIINTHPLFSYAIDLQDKETVPPFLEMAKKVEYITGKLRDELEKKKKFRRDIVAYIVDRLTVQPNEFNDFLEKRQENQPMSILLRTHPVFETYKNEMSRFQRNMNMLKHTLMSVRAIQQQSQSPKKAKPTPPKLISRQTRKSFIRLKKNSTRKSSTKK